MAVIFGYELLTMGVFFVLWFLSFPLTFGPFLRRVPPQKPRNMFATRRASRFLSAAASQGMMTSAACRSKYTLVLVRHGESTWNQVCLSTYRPIYP